MSFLQEEITKTFAAHFNTRGYNNTPELPLITDDKTICFTNATIVAWKQNLLDSTVPSPGFHMKQRCLRLHGLSDELYQEMVSEREFDRFIGAFNMVGILTGPAQRAAVQQDIISLFTEGYAIDPSDLHIEAQPDMDFIDGLRKHCTVRYSALPAHKYRWVYGLPGIEGYGATIQLRKGDRPYEEIGQLIAITRGSQLVGYEFGFGVETFLTRLQGGTTYDAWHIAQATPKEHRFHQYLQSVSSFALAHSTPLADRAPKVKKEMRRLARRVVAVEDYFDIEPQSTASTIECFLSLELGTTQPLSGCLEDLDKTRNEQEEAVAHYTDFVKSMRSRNISSADALKRAKHACRTYYHLGEQQTAGIVQEVYLQ